MEPESGLPNDKAGPRVGPVLFVLKYGLLPWGLIGGIAYWVLEVMRGGDPAATAWYTLKLFPALGLGAGVVLWVFAQVRAGPRRGGSRK